MAGGFRFNFSLDLGAEDHGSGHSGLDLEKGDAGCKSSVPKCAHLSKLVPILPWHSETVSCIAPNVIAVPGCGTKLYYVSGQQVYDIARETRSSKGDKMELESLLALSDSQHSDLIPGVYEGGLKLWECAVDLVEYLSESNINFHGMRILELGCGIGLPGIYSATRGAKEVHFQDFNPQVLNYVTIPSVMLNTGSKIWNETTAGNGTGDRSCETKDQSYSGNEKIIADAHSEGRGTESEIGGERFKFYSGDWSGLASVLESADRYDLILTSETIYSLDSQPKLLSALKQLSSEGTGVVYVAAKTFYFGVGGGINSFCQLVENDGTFDVFQCRRFDASVPRVILKLSHHKS